QDILLAAAKEAQTFQRKTSRDAQDVALANLKKSMEYTELPPAEVAKVRTKLKPVIDKYSANVGADFGAQGYTETEKRRGKYPRLRPSARGAPAATARRFARRSPLNTTMRNVGIAVAGAGLIGPRHIEEIRKRRCAT